MINLSNKKRFFIAQIVPKPSNGFIMSESAMNAPGANYPPRGLPGSSHFQMRYDENTKDAVEKIFEDGIGRTFFQTDKRL